MNGSKLHIVLNVEQTHEYFWKAYLLPLVETVYDS